VELGAIIEWADDLDEFRRVVRLADDLRYGRIGVGDTPARAWELYVSLTGAAHETRHATVAPMVTTPFLRHPVATATAMATVHELTGGRALLAVGNGGSVRRVVGRSPVTGPAELRDYVVALKSVMAGGSAHVDGFDTEPLERVRPVPLLIAADYPASLRLAGEHADGVVTTVGTSVERVRRKIAVLREAAEQAGRDPDAIAVFGLRASAGDLREALRRPDGLALTEDAARRLFPAGDALGKAVNVRGHALTILALMARSPRTVMDQVGDAWANFDSPVTPVDPRLRDDWHSMQGKVLARVADGPRAARAPSCAPCR